jgi:steroid delta-isomerase-like uncharacterized protein
MRKFAVARRRGGGAVDANLSDRQACGDGFMTEITMHNRREIAAAGMLLAGGAVSGALAQSNASPQGLAERFAATLSAHDIDAFAALFAENYVNHQFSAAAPPQPPNISQKQGSVGFFKARLTGIPDLKVGIEAMVADKDHVAASFVYTGTHGGLYFGVPPTGRPLRFTSCDIFRIKDGLIAEHWGMGDIAGVLAQLKA